MRGASAGMGGWSSTKGASTLTRRKQCSPITGIASRKNYANERSLCGHVHASPRGVPEWEWAPYAPVGAVNAKAADSSLVSAFAFKAHAGLPCGQDFIVHKFLEAHPEFAGQRSLLCDMKGNP